MARFVETRYDSDQGVTMALRMSSTEFASVTASSTAQDFEAHAYSSGSRRRFGIHARGFIVSRQLGTAPLTFTESKFVAIPTVAEYDGASVGDAFTVGSESYTISKKVRELAV